MIFRSKKKENTEQVEARPAVPEPPPEAPKVAQRMERIEPPSPTPEAPQNHEPPLNDDERKAHVEARARLHEAVGKIALAAISEPRYRNLPISEMRALFLEPLLQNRIAIASQSDESGGPAPDAPSAMAIWASVSTQTDAKIREQIDAGSYPVRLQPEDWNSGEINWLLDIIAPNQRLATAVIANFRQVLDEGNICIHPMVARALDRDVLEKMGAKPIAAPDPAPA